ncbi:uncharacterized protein LOC124897914 [Capsicum annuum]|uniref:uncharacterized protein LOC124897914 n=1 Tax=Capsicum annuum TaxID=4072 RepID=UPI001FB0E524|nr:uncharacterized protein LOC124897914 [Capsicum annuum]
MIKDIDIFRLVVHMQQVEEKKRKQAKFQSGDRRQQSGDNFGAYGAQSQASSAQSVSSCPPCQFCGRLYRGFCDEGRYMCFKYGQSVHMLKNFLVVKGASEVSKALIALSFTLILKGAASASVSASGTGTCQN